MNTAALCTPPTAKTNWKNLVPTRLSLNSFIILYICPWPTGSSSIVQASGPCLRSPKFMKLCSYSSRLQDKSPCTCSIEMTSITWEHPEGTNGLPSELLPRRILWGHHLPCVYRWEQPHTQAGMHNPLYRTRAPTGSTLQARAQGPIAIHPVNLSVDSSLTSHLKPCMAISRRGFEQS